MKLPLRIIATGVAAPAELHTSAALDARLGLPPGTVQQKSGVISRRFARATDSQSELAAQALSQALANASLRPSHVDLLISTSGVPEQALPSTAAAIARHLPFNAGTPAFDVGASCLGFMTGLHVAAHFLATGTYRRIAVVASDLASRGIDWADPEASLIFGDGAAAAIVDRGTGEGFQSFCLETYPEGFAHCEVRAGGTRCNPRVGAEPRDYLFRMDGKAVFKLASRTVPALLDKALAAANTTMDKLDVIVPHQASHLGMAHLTKRLGLPEERLVNIYATHGNQVSASMPTALHSALVSGQVRPGHRILLLGTAAGFTAGAAVLDL